MTGLFCCSALMISLCGDALADNWPRWRGPENNGISSEAGLATEWSGSENVSWRLELPGPGPATPIVWEDRIFLTSSEGDSLALLCVSTSGELLWNKVIGNGNRDVRQGESNGAAPSPSTDGKHVWAYFGTGVVVCFDLKGKGFWRTNLDDRYGKFKNYFGSERHPCWIETGSISSCCTPMRRSFWHWTNPMGRKCGSTNAKRTPRANVSTPTPRLLFTDTMDRNSCSLTGQTISSHTVSRTAARSGGAVDSRIPTSSAIHSDLLHHPSLHPDLS